VATIPAAACKQERAMLKTGFLTAAAVLAFGVAPALAQSPHPASQARSTPQASSATQAGAPTAAVATAPAVGVVIDPQAKTAVIVPVNLQADVPPEVTVLLKGLYATGKIKPGQVAHIVLQHGNQVTEVITNAPQP
jgi:hypothetical protein